MSNFKKTVNSYRLGEDWQKNFKHINYVNFTQSVKSILQTTQAEPIYDRFGNHVAGGQIKPLSLNEVAFRIAVLADQQLSGKK